MINLILALFCIFMIGSCVDQCTKIGDNECGYCKLHWYHVLCAYPEKGKNCHEPYREIIPDKDQQRDIVDWHNRMRQKVATGNETRGVSGPQPPAANMMKMAWDPELARIAQRIANQCIVGENCPRCMGVLGERFKVGQIAAHKLYLTSYFSPDFVTVIMKFYDEQVNLVNSAVIDDYWPSSNYSLYTQMVWWNSRSVGCGGAKYRSRENPDFDEFLVYCNYGAGGNGPTESVYTKGKACWKCPEETQCDARYPGLCAISKKPFNVQEEFETDKMHLF